MPWIVFFVLCPSLRVKDALSKNYFTTVDELLFRIYYLYEKSPKKCHELNVVAELKQCLEPGDLPAEGGNRPLRACGIYTFCGSQSGSSRENY